jgi:hypothetical protein
VDTCRPDRSGVSSIDRFGLIECVHRAGFGTGLATNRPADPVGFTAQTLGYAALPDERSCSCLWSALKVNPEDVEVKVAAGASFGMAEQSVTPSDSAACVASRPESHDDVAN